MSEASGNISSVTELAYMTISDWGQRGTAMESQSARIRDWLGEHPYLITVESRKGYESTGSLDATFVKHLLPKPEDRFVVAIQELFELTDDDSEIRRPVVVLRPFSDPDCDLIARLVQEGRLKKVFVLVHHEGYPIKNWLDGMSAVDLHTGLKVAPPEPVMLEAVRAIRDEEYNGLSSGRGKDAIVQLVNAFANEGFAVDPAPWVQAYFAEGGTFHHAASISKLVTEMRKGVRHRVKPRFRDEIYDILKARIDGGGN